MNTYIQFYRARLRANKNNSTADVIHFIDKTILEQKQLHFVKQVLWTKKRLNKSTC